MFEHLFYMIYTDHWLKFQHELDELTEDEMFALYEKLIEEER